MQALLTNYYQYLQSQIRIHKEKIEKYQADQCIDDANLERIKLNIVEMYQTVAAAVEKQIKPGANALEAFSKAYMEKTSTIKAPWSMKQETAKQHAHGTKQLIEEAKIETANKLDQVFQKMRGTTSA